MAPIKVTPLPVNSTDIQIKKEKLIKPVVFDIVIEDKIIDTIDCSMLYSRQAKDDEGNIYNFYTNIYREQFQTYLKLIEEHGDLIAFGFSDIAVDYKMRQIPNNLSIYAKYDNVKHIIDFNEAVVKYLTEH